MSQKAASLSPLTILVNLRLIGPFGGEHSSGEETSSSLLYRLIDVAARALEAASTYNGHLAQRYSVLLRGMIGIVETGKANTPGQRNFSGPADVPVVQEGSSGLSEDLWTMWQQAGLDPALLQTM